MLFVLAVKNADSELLQALTIAPLLILLTVPVAIGIARRDGDRTLVSIVMAGVAAKLLAALVRYYVAFVAYHGGSDASQYNSAGRVLAPEFRRFIFTADVGKLVGTGFTKILTGVVYAIFGVGRIAGFLVFAWVGFLGLLLFARAFRIAVPDGDGRRYLLLLLFFPSLLYWPSAIGKEAWMMLALGLSAYGVACIFRGRATGTVALVPGLFLVLMIRPHLSLVLFVGVVFSFLMRRAPARTYAAPVFRLLGLAVLVAMGVFLAGQTAEFLGQDSLNTRSVGSELTATEAQTAEGGSAFTPVRVKTPIHIVPAFVTVFFRPFPWEAGNAQGLLTSAETLLLLGLCVAARRRLRNVWRLMRTTPYVAFAVGYVLAFTFAFSSFGNFGILARQRVQAVPLLLALLVVPPFRREETSRSSRSLRSPRDGRARGEPIPPVRGDSEARPEPARAGRPAIPAASRVRRSRRP